MNDFYKKYNVDINRLSRDFLIYPLKPGVSYHPSERPTSDDMKYLYLELNCSICDLSIYFNRSKAFIEKFCLKDYNIKKNKTISKIIIDETFYEKYNIDKNKLTRDYLKYPLKIYLGKHDSERPKKSDIKYLFIYKNIRASIVAGYFKTNIATLRKWCKLYSISKSNKKALKNSVDTFIHKYGVKNVSYIPDIVNKRYITKTKNHTHCSSKPENLLFELLLKEFDEVKRQYKSEKYPFACDFYIPKLDLYIEYQGNWTHGPMGCHEPFDKNNIKHLKMLKTMNSKAILKSINKKNQYSSAIEVWTVKDPLKRQIAKENNLNWIEFFTIKEAKDWLDKECKK